MYLTHFGLDESPFSITPDPRFLYLSDRYREALAHLLYGADQAGGFVQLTGEVGTGKTMTVRAFLAQLPDGVDAALVLNPKVTAAELLRTVLDELRVPTPEARDSTMALVNALNSHLLDAHARGRRTVLLIDEAQTLSGDVLEQVRLLTNLETERHKLLQIFLIGQPELRELLEAPRLRQVAQRITARYHLVSLTFEETCAYVQHRLRVAGAQRPLFTRGALREVSRHSRGIPRLINVICDRALLGAYATDRPQVTRRVVWRAAAELKGDKPRRPMWLAAAGLVGLGLAVGWVGQLPAVRSTVAAALGPIDGLRPVVVAATSAAPAAAPPSILQAVAPAASAVELPAYLRLQQLLRSEPASRDRAAAEDTLLSLWEVAPDGGGLCPPAEAAGLRCMDGHGGWDELRGLGLPAILQFQDGAVRRHALLTGVGAGTITVQVGDRSHTLAVTELDGYWQGDFQLLWRPPLDGAFIIGSRSTPAALAWLRGALDVEEEAGAAYDETLREAVRRFQRSVGLSDDGVAGPRTLIHLAVTLADGIGPRLAARTEE